MELKEKETKAITKEEAISEVKKIFKGNKKFIEYCQVMIASTDNFIGIDDHDIYINNWNWEKLLRLTINFSYYNPTYKMECKGFKTITYRKGNKRYAPGNTRIDKGNTTSEIHDYKVFTYTGESSETTWNA